MQTGENYQALIDAIDSQLKNPELSEDEIDTLLDKRQRIVTKMTDKR